MRTPTHAGSPSLARASGFSLVEMMVALVFISLLMAGMLRVFASSLSNFNMVNETLGAQRSVRWGSDMLSDEVSQAGLLLPDRPLPEYIVNGAESIFQVIPGQAVAIQRQADGDPSSVVADSVLTDVLQFLTDVPLPVSARVGAETTALVPALDGSASSSATGSTSVLLDFPNGGESQVKAKDLLVVLDSAKAIIDNTTNDGWEFCRISSWDASTKVASFVGNTEAEGKLYFNHPVGLPVALVRPHQVRRYSIRSVALDPLNGAVTVPCLVRQQADYPLAGSVDWSAVANEVLMENVEGFTVDLSFNGGTSWVRSGASTWAAMRANAETQLATAGLAGYRSLADPQNPVWYRNIQFLMRLELRVRVPVRRTEYAPAGNTMAYRTRTQVLILSPRNFGVGA